MATKRSHVMAIDQGTTGSTVLVFDRRGRIVGRGYSEFQQYYPKPGWVEHDAEEIWRVTLRVARQALRRAGVNGAALAAIGITNQRETTIVWDRRTGAPVGRAIVWQDRRTADRCAELKAGGHEEVVRAKTGLVLDPYFSGTKVAWILDHVRNARARADHGDLAFGTVDSWLIWKLTGGRVHATDPTNAARTLLFDIHTRAWDPDLLRLLDVPAGMVPEVRPSSGVIAETEPALFGAAVPIAGVAGDQQAALFGQACFEPGMVKNTYGTGCFVLMQTGAEAVGSTRGLLTTIACGAGGVPTYALEGSVFIAGAAIQWLRDGLEILRTAGESERLARSVDSTLGVYLVPAFVGLGAPYWDPDARGAILGLTRGVTRAHVVRAALESLAYQTRDVVETMASEAGHPIRVLRVDGGAAANDFLMQFQADVLGTTVERPKVIETTALGAAMLAGLGVGLWTQAELERVRAVDRVFKSKMPPERRAALYDGWKAAVARVRSGGSGSALTLRARDVMQTEVLAVAPSLSLIELADFLIRERISGVPVVADGELIGHVSRSDLVRAGSLERSLAGLAAEAVDAPEFAPASEPTLVASLATLAPELQARSVRDIMVTEVITVTPETPITEVARLLLAHHLHRVVVSEGRQVRGVISALDLVRLIADERLRPG